MGQLVNAKDGLHIVPNGDLRPHDTAKTCWCRPTQDDESTVWVHHSLDRRELYETGEQQLH